jgi:hypothetical protein
MRAVPIIPLTERPAKLYVDGKFITELAEGDIRIGHNSLEGVVEHTRIHTADRSNPTAKQRRDTRELTRSHIQIPNDT